MRPDFSVRHSPRLTNRNGTPTRSAPPTIAGEERRRARRLVMRRAPRRCDRRRSARRLGAARWRQRAATRRPVDAAQRLAGQDQHEGDALQHQHRRVGQAEAALQQAAGGAEAAEQDRDRDDRERVVARDERRPGCRRSRSRRSATRWRWCAPPRPRPRRPGRRRRRRARRRAGSAGSPAGRRAARCAGCRRPRAPRSRAA